MKQVCHSFIGVPCSWNGNGTRVLRSLERNGNAPHLKISIDDCSFSRLCFFLVFNLTSFSNEFQIRNIKKTRLFLNVVEIDVLENALFGLEKYRSIYSLNAIRNIGLSKTDRKRSQLDGRRLDSLQYRCQCQYMLYKFISTLKSCPIIDFFAE